MSKFTVVVAALSMIASGGFYSSALAQGAPDAAMPGVVVLPIAALGSPSTPSTAFSAQACTPFSAGSEPRSADDNATNSAGQSGLPAQLTNALSREIREGGRTVSNDLHDTSPGALVIAGCIVRADPGDPAKRLVGMGMGASVLSVHVQVYRDGLSHLDLIGEFDTEVQGKNKLPPIGPVGLAVHGIRGRGLTLSADADKLAKLIARRVLTGQFTS